MVDAPDRLKLPDTQVFLPNSTNCGGTKITITQALKVSCNTAFANLGLEVGQDKLREQAQAVRLRSDGTWPILGAWPASSRTSSTRPSWR